MYITNWILQPEIEAKQDKEIFNNLSFMLKVWLPGIPATFSFHKAMIYDKLIQEWIQRVNNVISITNGTLGSINSIEPVKCLETAINLAAKHGVLFNNYCGNWINDLEGDTPIESFCFDIELAIDEFRKKAIQEKKKLMISTPCTEIN